MNPDKLDQILKQSKDNFDIYSPPDGHEARFRSNLQKNYNKVRSLVFLKVASIIVVAFLGGALSYHFFLTSDNDKYQLMQNADEYRNMEMYYSWQVDAKLAEIENSSLVSGDQKIRIESEMQEFKKLYLHLQEELKTHPEDERIINAMIQNYQSRVELLNLIIAQLNEIKKRNNYEIQGKADI